VASPPVDGRQGAGDAVSDLDPTTSWIAGLMRHNYEAVGFIPAPTVATQYVQQGRYVLQTDERGRRVGYLLHGKPTPGGILTVAQHCIDLDWRLRGYGEAAFDQVVARARAANCRGLKVRCAATLPSTEFWQAMGLALAKVTHPTNYRQRAVNVYLLDLWPVLPGIRVSTEAAP
jgi:GNAT superfamily N-acetyltransferase